MMAARETAKRQRDPKRDRELTDRFHRWFSNLKAPRRTRAGTKWDADKPIDWAGWPIIRVDIRMLR